MQVVILIGLQGAGKSTFYRRHFAATHRHISKDNFRHNKNPERRQQTLLQEALEQGCSVVIDNTNATMMSRAPLLALARQFDAGTVGYYFETSLKECLERNRGREGKQRVPDIALFATAKRLELPALIEGFDQLYAVQTLGESRFEVKPWN